jgi:hypothetical protein
LEEIVDDFRGMKELVGFFTVNISDVIRRLRTRAQVGEAGNLRSNAELTPDDELQRWRRKKNDNAG